MYSADKSEAIFLPVFILMSKAKVNGIATILCLIAIKPV
jgi:hypothetical protein